MVSVDVKPHVTLLGVAAIFSLPPLLPCLISTVVQHSPAHNAVRCRLFAAGGRAEGDAVGLPPRLGEDTGLQPGQRDSGFRQHGQGDSNGKEFRLDYKSKGRISRRGGGWGGGGRGDLHIFLDELIREG